MSKTQTATATATTVTPLVFPCTLYLRNRNGYSMTERIVVTGETSRSWLSGPSYNHYKHSKHDYEIVTETDYHDDRWAMANRYEISQLVQNCRRADVLRKVAEAVGYKKPEGPEGPEEPEGKV